MSILTTVQPGRPASAAEAVLDRLARLHPIAIDLSLERVRALLARLGNPQDRLPHVIHVAGTNGKGSTLAHLRAMLEAAGLRVNTYTSPHLVRFHERIRLAAPAGGSSAEIADDALAAVLEEVERANDGAPVTHFEITTAAALLAFSRHPADATLVEVGLGGRLDATNVFQAPAACVVTRLSFDHMSFLGDSLTGIAAEKAAIARPGVPLVLGWQEDATAFAAAIGTAEAAGARVLAAGRDWTATPTATGFAYRGPRWQLDLPRSALPGLHQVQNAGNALAALEALALPAVDEPALRRGLAAAAWPARLQRLTRGPLLDLLPAGAELWLDGGHNDSAGDVLGAHAASAWADAHPLHLVFGMVQGKQTERFLAPLQPHAASLTAIPIPQEPRSLSAEDAAAAARAAGFAQTSVAESAVAALRALPSGPLAPRVLVCGSLYLAGTVLAEHG